MIYVMIYLFIFKPKERKLLIKKVSELVLSKNAKC